MHYGFSLFNFCRIIFEGTLNCSYDIESPQSASEPSALNQVRIEALTEFDINSSDGSSVERTSLSLNVLYDNNQAIEDIPVQVIDANNQTYDLMLTGGLLQVDNLPQGQCTVIYQGLTSDEELRYTQLRQDFKQALADMLTEIKQRAEIEDAIFEDENFLNQWLIETGARMTGVYQGAEMLVTGVADLAILGYEISAAVYSANIQLLINMKNGDVSAIKNQIETILENTDKSFDSLSEAFDTLVILTSDLDLISTLAQFPSDYLAAHSHVEQQRIWGIFTFEILLTVLTGGVGAAVSLASKSKHLVKANKALLEIAQLLKRKRLAKTQTKPIKQFKTDIIDKPEPVLKIGRKRKPAPKSMAEALTRLTLARENIIKHGYIEKYTDKELLAMAKSGDVANERFHVRFMEASYLEYKGNPGTLGAPFKGQSGSGAKYWSTTFDQLEDADSDPRLISLKLGLDYDPDKKFVMVIIDTDKAKIMADTHSIIPTHKNLGQFAKDELPDNFSVEEINKLMTPEFQDKYAKHYQDALDSGVMKNEWDTNML
ncbi:hypothetical protein [Pseudoalteromonas denitrificans]|uniref:Uncharacterized protein n=1 Tax=Pseudoalteromonas denitrificans DSM 6059 TaxID=1123010 RepID=A0A1I1V3J8_9GAMM|nr:hypothetical protein [Pseudoalteromonas denitrificans]SFD77484.1 hypothetical protein SAMN02745724_05415 [Pseudoalteromonas denitrificans DSM 6059]